MKQKIREEIRKKREVMNREDVFSKSYTIQEKLKKTAEFRNAKNVLFYVSTKNEVETHRIIEELLSSGEKNVIVPITDKKNKILKLSVIKSFSELTPRTHGILEPENKFIRPIEPEKVDLVIVPGIAFDKSGNRIGSGQGYYDKLLNTMKNTKKVGLAFELQVIDDIPQEDHDVPVDMIITEKRIIKANENDKK
ncbi:MAG: 5-formyltetrahydrofolate cyclo-ligase [Candidatus Aenigmarchaeota archaeon]|nr:5-formyltetrahydrofolate cyclo-ligase [Candidatus Aenigmarchaeota archaeon]